jgi:hypothetical protein
MPQTKRKSGAADADPGQPVRDETDRERREEEEQGGERREGRRSRDVARPDGDGTAGRAPSPEPDVFMDIPKVKVEEIYLDVEGLDAHLSLRTRLANLVQLVAGVHVHCGKVELDIKGVEAEAMLKVRLENLYDILDRALTTIDRNPQILESLLKTVDTAVDDVGQTAQTALGPGGAASRAVDQVGQTAQQALGPGGAGSKAVNEVGGAAKEAVGPGGAVTQTGQAAGQAVDDTAQGVGEATKEVGADAGQAAGQVGQGSQVGQVGQGAGQAAGQVGQTPGDSAETAPGVGDDGRQQGDAGGRRARRGETKRGSKRGSKRGTRRSRSYDDQEERSGLVGRAVQVGQVTQQALGRLTGGGARKAAGEPVDQVGVDAGSVVQQVGEAAGAAVRQMGQAASEAVQHVGHGAANIAQQGSEPDVEASGRATIGPDSERRSIRDSPRHDAAPKPNGGVGHARELLAQGADTLAGLRRPSTRSDTNTSD